MEKRSHSLGKYGEKLAADMLRRKGYTIREINWRTGHKEIDIVADKDNYIIFAEVKTRSADYQLHPRDAVTTPKQRNIIFAAETYLKLHRIMKEVRFDIITVIADGKKITTEHIEDGFYPTL